jgi:hypothetical protein
MGITHATIPAGTDSGDGTVSKNAWSEDHSVTGLFYSASSASSTAVTDNADWYDINALSISSVLAGTYLLVCSITMSSKSGTVRYVVTDGSNTSLWPVGGSTYWNAVNNSDSRLQMAISAVITIGSTSTIKLRGAAVAAVSNYTVYDRHLTLVRLS